MDLNPQKPAEKYQQKPEEGMSRREFMGKALKAGAVGAGIAMGVDMLGHVKGSFDEKPESSVEDVAELAKNKIESIEENIKDMKKDLQKLKMNEEAFAKINKSIGDWEIELSVLKDESGKTRPMSIMISKLEDLDKAVSLKKLALEHGTHLG